jgi:putative intracellular protease/amidase
MSNRTRRALRVVASSALALLTLTGFAAAGGLVTGAEATTPAPTHLTGPAPTNRPSSDGPIKVAVVLGASGTVVSDALAPYEVFASSPQFSVYTVAAKPTAHATQGGPAIVPTYTFADTTSGRAPRPDVVVVPAVATADEPAEAPTRAWISAQARAGSHILGVCNGAEFLAATGLLNGRTATAHWSRLGALRRQYPHVKWVAGQRSVQDGPVTTTAGVTSGIPGALRVMADLAGPAEATRVGQLVGYPHWSLTEPADIPTQSFAASDVPVGLNALIPWGRPTVGIALADGIGEIDIASSFEVFDVSYAARPIPLSATGTVTTKDGMVLDTNTPGDDPTPTRVAVPGPAGTANLNPTLRAWANQQHVPIDAVHGPGNAPGFDGALQYLSRHGSRATALSAAKMIDYPSAQLRLHDNGGVRIPLLVALGLALVAAAASLPTLVRRARRSSAAGV